MQCRQRAMKELCVTLLVHLHPAFDVVYQTFESCVSHLRLCFVKKVCEYKQVHGGVQLLQ